jgi:Spy/CpxP family protein refolding chaperone
MMKSRFALVAAVAALSAAVFAQGAPQAGPRAERSKGSAWMQELGLTEAQKQQIDAIRQEAREGLKGAMKGGEKTDARRAQIRQGMGEMKSRIEAVLTADQKAKLESMKAQKKSEWMAKTGLTADQMAKMKSIRESAMAQFKSIKDNESLSRDEKRTEMKAVAETMKAEAAKVLSPEQLEKIKALKGEWKTKRKRGGAVGRTRGAGFQA